ncbi:conserved hypothetical protein [Desulforapulum autotrophicum HRM2]|uniref:DUF2066 domain-containing protein n=1 Tax=Desulforapulum autotrophicum (strain ATCC 43914 / DSM 3382 / VKM B-1955 / HRM2) TaxID=177437 RepID=C0QIB3_DESAH|nr:hypothetical protein [Desulforapulum autotrophicum]ACN17857.1 conserved hypothetical protein [Desulforapulum autotrophicum HRM2]
MMRRMVTGLAGLMVLFVLLGMVTTDGVAAPEKKKLISLGKQTIVNDKLPQAKKAAISDALYRSVERVVLDTLSQADITGNLDLIYGQVLSDAERYVETYRVLAEVEREGQYLVAVESAVNTPALEEVFTRTGIVNTEKMNPSVLLLISEQSYNEVLSRYWWGKNPLPYTSFAEGSLIDILEKKGFTLVGKGPDRPNLEALGIAFDFVHDSVGALKLAGALKADILVMGRARADEPSNRMGDERSYPATVDLEVFVVETGEPMGTIDQSAVAKSSVESEGPNQALAQAGDLAAEALSARVSDFWSARPQTVHAIETRVEGTDYLSSFILLRKVLNDMPGIQDVKTKELGSDRAMVEIMFKGNAETLANNLMLKTFDLFTIEISEVTPSSMVLRFVTQKDVAPVPESEIKKAYISE